MNKRKEKIITVLAVLGITIGIPIYSRISYFDNKQVMVNQLKYYEVVVKNLQSNLNDLTEFYNYNYDETDYKIAKVINRDIYGLSNIIIINIGVKDGIKKGMPVIFEDQLIGIVSDAKDSISYVDLIQNKDITLSVKINDNYGLYNDGVIKNIKDKENIKSGDFIYTSGLTVIPANLKIGQIKDIIDKSNDFEREATVEINLNVYSLKYVLVLKTEGID